MLCLFLPKGEQTVWVTYLLIIRHLDILKCFELLSEMLLLIPERINPNIQFLSEILTVLLST